MVNKLSYRYILLLLKPKMCFNQKLGKNIAVYQGGIRNRMKTKTVLLTAAVVATGIGILGIANKKISLPKRGTVKK